MPTTEPAAYRTTPAGLLAGAPLSRIRGPDQALLLVAEPLERSEHALHELIRSEVRAVPAIASYLLFAGGKRLRPALSALGAKAIGVERDLSRLMCVGELIHLGSLLHDDVVDEAATRRNQPATHRVFGNGVTVLTGDFCLARAVLLAAEEGGYDAVTALASAVTEMAEGEVLQLEHAGDLRCTREQYFEVINKKSAALIAWCAASSAYAVKDRAAAALLARFGRAVGLAFQITDDVFDYREGTGKTSGMDLRQRKLTLPLLYALDEVKGLPEALAEPPEEEVLPAMIREITASGALEHAMTDANELVETAIDALEPLPRGRGRDALCVLAHHLVERVR